MQRHLIHHGDDGTWDLVVDGEAWTVEHKRHDLRRTFSISDFEATPDGQRLAEQLTQALIRAVKQ